MKAEGKKNKDESRRLNREGKTRKRWEGWIKKEELGREEKDE